LAIALAALLAGEAAAGAPEDAPGLKEAGKTPAATTSELEKLLRENPASLAAMILLKYVLAAVGVALLLVANSHRSAVRRGLIPPPPTRPPPTPATSVPAAFGIVVATALVTAVGGQAVAKAYGEGGTPLAVALLVTGAPSLAAAALFLALRARAIRRTGNRPAPAGEAVRMAFWGICVFSTIGLVVGLVWGLVVHLLRLPEEPQEIVRRAFHGPVSDLLLIAGFGVLVAPFTEECAFRGLLYGSLRISVKPIPAAAAVSVVFAAVHGNWQALGPLVALACMLAWLYERTNSVLAVVLCHALFNASMLVPLLLFRLA
jgi:membrane protease YdiL (CAAX protease family)